MTHITLAILIIILLTATVAMASPSQPMTCTFLPAVGDPPHKLLPTPIGVIIDTRNYNNYAPCQKSPVVISTPVPGG